MATCPICKTICSGTTCNICGFDKVGIDFLSVEDAIELSSKQNFYLPPEPHMNSNVGDIVRFGTYPYSAQGDTSPLLWIIIKSDSDTFTLITKDCIDSVEFLSVANVSRMNNLSWHNSDIRKWLNNEFLATAFSDTERNKIILSTNSNKAYNMRIYVNEEDSVEKVFLLNKNEAEALFMFDEDRKAIATPYAVNKGADNIEKNNGCSWWLRSPSSWSSMHWACETVLSNGMVDDSNLIAFNPGIGVRPVMRIKKVML